MWRKLHGGNIRMSRGRRERNREGYGIMLGDAVYNSTIMIYTASEGGRSESSGSKSCGCGVASSIS